jgi:hypothetical protein
MTSSRFVLVFLGFVFIVIVVLSSGRIAGALRSRFGGFFPTPNILSDSSSQTLQSTPTPTHAPQPTMSPTNAPKPTVTVTNRQSVPIRETPATGLETIFFITTSLGLGTGLYLRRKTS